ncbi:MAG: LytTR family DNA-binding domain-containing protein [Bacteroidales bacterium]|nr:LytTR family DNA-binding domain-containing protein [Bacteroidales bacterium]MCF8454308.1 LytTR family DNA-binding domain-containing protein [Bacteroidales bacterium]
MKLLTFERKLKHRMLNAIIIDDEPHIRQTLEKMVVGFCPNLKLVATADSVESGVNTIRKYHPDLVLLDIKMNDGTGFDLLKKLEPVDFKVIFITAYDKYAIKAFKFSAIDYLLKPVDPADLRAAAERAEKLYQKDFNTQLNTLEENLQLDASNNKKKIILKTYDNIHLVKVCDINYCESEGGYTSVNMLNGNKIMVSCTLKEYDDMLSETGFFRVHKSFLINMRHINRFEKAEGGHVVLENEIKIPVASRKRDDLLEMFEKLAASN